MSTIGIICGLRSHRWEAAVRSLRQNTFAPWIAARWALPAREPQHTPQRDFKTSRRSPWREPALSVRVLQGASFYSTWNFAFYLASSPPSNVFVFLRHVHPNWQLHSSQFNTSLVGREQVRFKWTASLRSHPVRLHLRTRIDPGVMLSQSVMNSTMTLLSLLRTFAERTDCAVYHSAQFTRGDASETRMLAQSWGVTAVPGARSNRPVWISCGISSLSANAQRLGPALWRSASSTSRFVTTLFRSHRNSRLCANSFQRFTEHQNRMMTLSLGGKTKEETRQHSQLLLQLRTEGERTVSRPPMQFVQPAPSTQPELLSAIHRMETAVTKFHGLQAPAGASGPDVQRLTSQVYDQFERQLRIERERRGR